MRVLAETSLHAPGLRLDPLRPQDAGRLFEPLSDPELYRFIPEEPPAGLPVLRARFETICRRGPSDNAAAVWLNWVCVLEQTGGPVGWVQATATPDGAADFAYFVFSAHQGRGYAREALSTVARVVAAQPGAATLGASVDTRNAASIRLLESAGFLRVAFVEAADAFKGAVSDEYRYELSYNPDRTGVPNAATISAVAELEGGNGRRFSNAAALFKDLGI